ncbi:MFS general substrate transporter, partial [Artomyces pyxidatus]
MAQISIFHDTLFAYTIRWASGSRVFRHPDEVDPSILWQDAVRPTAYSASIQEVPVQVPGEKDSPNSLPKDVEGQSWPDSRQTHLPNPSPSQSIMSLSPTGTIVIDSDTTRPDLEKGDDTILVDWYGPDDPENPLNWSSLRKAWILFQTCFLTFAVYIGSSIYTAGIADVSDEFHVSHVAATLGLTMFVLGYGVAPMIFSPMSEMPQMGRMPIYLVTLAIFVVLQVPTALATNFGMLLAFRFITGFFGSPILGTGGATIADLYVPKKRAYGITLWGVFGTSAPAMGPLVGGFAAHAKGWRWTIWELMWLSGSALVVLLFFYPETSASNILYRRAARLREATGNPNLKSQGDIDAANMTARDLAAEMLVRPLVLNFQEPIVLALNIYIGLIYALLYIWFESFPIVFIDIYHFEPQLLG